MKRFLIFLMIFASIGFASIGVEAKTSGTAVSASSASHMQLGQIFRRRRWRNWGNRNNGTVRYETRIVHKGYKVYRDTYRITWKNGHETVKRVNRVRIR